MRKITFVLFLLFVVQTVVSQSCLPDGITFETQSQIDSFSINYPGCTQIEGWVKINGDSISNLSGLGQITDIFGNLEISGNYILVNLNGLTSLDSIGGSLNIMWNYQLINLSGIESLRVINQNLYVGFHWGISNPLLESLTGLEGLKIIGGELYLSWNPLIPHLNPLMNLDSIGGSLTIRYNTNLSTCDALSICNYLSSPNSRVNIYENKAGCNHPYEISNHCGFAMDCLPYGNYFFFNQTDIDSFAFYYPGCKKLEGSVWIQGDMTNLHGLNMIQKVGLLFLRDVFLLTDLSGLDSLTTISSSAFIGMATATGNLSLNSLSGLNNLDTIGESLYIIDNPVLTDISALDSLDGTTLISLQIIDNPLLSDCDAKGICDFLNLASMNLVLFSDNAPGCNEYWEVMEACGIVAVQEHSRRSELIFYPNPASDKIYFLTADIPIEKIIIYNNSGQEVFCTETFLDSVDVSTLKPGMYIVEVMVENRKIRQKLLVQR